MDPNTRVRSKNRPFKAILKCIPLRVGACWSTGYYRCSTPMKCWVRAEFWWSSFGHFQVPLQLEGLKRGVTWRNSSTMWHSCDHNPIDSQILRLDKWRSVAVIPRSHAGCQPTNGKPSSATGCCRWLECPPNAGGLHHCSHCSGSHRRAFKHNVGAHKGDGDKSATSRATPRSQECDFMCTFAARQESYFFFKRIFSLEADWFEPLFPPYRTREGVSVCRIQKIPIEQKDKKSWMRERLFHLLKVLI